MEPTPEQRAQELAAVTIGKIPPEVYRGLVRAIAAALVEAGGVQGESDDDQPCPDPRCNDHLGAMPIPQCVTAVRWAEEADALRVVAEAARDFMWEPENWEAYMDSLDSISVAWSPEFLLMAQAVEKQYGAKQLVEHPTGEKE